MFELDLPNGTSVRQALDMTVEDAPDLLSILLDTQGRLHANFIIFRNGRNIEFFDGLDTSLSVSDTLDIFPKTGAPEGICHVLRTGKKEGYRSQPIPLFFPVFKTTR